MKRLISILFAGLVALSACSPESNGDNPENEQNNQEPTMVKLASVRNLTPDFISISGLEAGAEMQSGADVTLTVSAADILGGTFSSVHAEHIHVHVGDTVYIPESIADGVSSFALTFTAPEEDYDVVACYSVQQQFSESGYTMKLEDNDDEIRLYGVSENAKYKYFDCYLLVKDAYTVNSVEYKMGNGSWTSVEDSQGCSFARTTLEDVYKVTIRPGYNNVTGDVTLRVKGTQHARYGIRWENVDSRHVDLDKFVFPAEMIDGELVVAEVWTLEPYYLAGASSSLENLPRIQSPRTCITAA